LCTARPGIGETEREALVNAFPDFAYENSLLIDDDDPSKSIVLFEIAQMFNTRYVQAKNEIDLDKAISALDYSISLTPDGHPGQGERLKHLGVLLLSRSWFDLSSSDLDRAIFAFECSMIAGEAEDTIPGRLNNIGNSFFSEFLRTKDLINVDKAITAFGAAVRLTPEGHADKFELLHNLGVSWRERFKLTGKFSDIEEAFSIHHDALHLTSEGDTYRPQQLNDLGAAYIARFLHTGKLVDIDMAIDAHNGALRLTPADSADKPDWLNNLGTTITLRYERTGDPADIEKSISAQKEAVRLTPAGDEDLPGRLSNLGMSLYRFSQHTGRFDDMNEAISVQKDDIGLLPEGHYDKARCLCNVGLLLLARFEQTADFVDIDKAISTLNDGVRLLPEYDRVFSLNNLGAALMRRFQHAGELIDIDNAIEAQKEALRLIPVGHTSKPRCLTNLGTSFTLRFKRARELDDINNAIVAHNDAVSLTQEDHPEKPSWLSHLGNSLSERFRLLGDFADINKAISTHNDAIRLTPEGHSSKYMRHNNLAISLMRRFERSDDPIDLNNAISAYHRALDLTPDGHATKPTLLDNFGNSLMNRFISTRSSIDRDMAISQFRLCASSSVGPPLVRFNAAIKWARLALEDNTLSSLDGFEVAFTLLPRVVWLGQTVTSRHKELVSIGSIANEAAAAAIKFGQHETALEWLEQGRSVVWGQLLNLRSPFDELRDADGKLADDLVRISKASESASIVRDNSQTSSSQQLSIEQAAQHHRQLATDWNTLVDKARTIPGFDDFLRPKKFSKLAHAAQFGPVGVINIYKSRCDALIVMAELDEVIHVPLDGFSYDKAQDLQRSLNKLISAAGVRMRDIRGPRMVSTKPGDCGFDEILSALWTHVAKPVLDALAFSVGHGISK
jgi:tetratricopeptide (TPR) repeat protein